MVIAENMRKPSVKISVSDSESTDEANNSEENESVENDDADVESDVSFEEKHDDGLMVTNEGWADSVAKILSSKKPKNKKTLVLSKAKKHSDIVKKEKEEKLAFEIIGDTKNQKPQVKEESTSEPPVKKIKQEKSTIRQKPNILEKDRERLLAKIATKGVVQLFNAVRNQQKTLEKEMDRSELSEAKKEKILKKFDKRAFLDTLMGQSKSIVVEEQTKTLKNEVKAEDEQPKWSVLREDFMMGAKMKDWDKESVDE